MIQKRSLEQSQVIIQKQSQTSKYWDGRLTTSETNPFPLAPVNFVRLTAEKYEEMNKAWGDFITRIMDDEPSLASICVLGPGLVRDLDWIVKKVKAGSKVTIADSSKVACSNARKFLRKKLLHPKVKVIQTEFFEGWENGRLCDEETNAYFMSQVLQHQGEKMPEFMHHLGNFLKGLGRVVYIITPRLEDNDPEKVKWVHSVPLFDYQWLDELKKGLGGEIKVSRLGKHSYFNQCYTFFKIEKL